MDLIGERVARGEHVTPQKTKTKSSNPFKARPKPGGLSPIGTNGATASKTSLLSTSPTIGRKSVDDRSAMEDGDDGSIMDDDAYTMVSSSSPTTQYEAKSTSLIHLTYYPPLSHTRGDFFRFLGSSPTSTRPSHSHQHMRLIQPLPLILHQSQNRP